MRRETTVLGVKDICALVPGAYEVEFLREQARKSSSGRSHTRSAAVEAAESQALLSCCILRVVATGEEVEDMSRMTANARPGTRFIAIVELHARLAKIRRTSPIDDAELDHCTEARRAPDLTGQDVASDQIPPLRERVEHEVKIGPWWRIAGRAVVIVESCDV